MSVVDRDGKISIEKRDRPVLTYHAMPSDPAAPWRMNFIHPLASLRGANLTEDAPGDHPHHRGVFWAWRRVMIDGAHICDGWTGRDFAYRQASMRSRERADGGAEISAELEWMLTANAPPLPFLRELTHIVVHPDREGERRIAIAVGLRALVENVTLAGTDDEKTYGGPTIRFAHADKIRMSSDGSALTPQAGPVSTRASVEFSWTPKPSDFPECVRVACLIDGRPWTRWVLRHERGMQNCAFPGREPVAVPMDRDMLIEISISIRT